MFLERDGEVVTAFRPAFDVSALASTEIISLEQLGDAFRALPA